MSTIERTWKGKGWIAEIIRNEDGGGWALAMFREGDDEPVLVAPWVMGRNKVDPKPMNEADFTTQVKAAQDFLTRTEYQRRTAFRRSFIVIGDQGARVRVVFDVEPDEFEPMGLLVAYDALDGELARVECSAGYTLTRSRAQAWVEGGFGRIEGGETPGW